MAPVEFSLAEVTLRSSNNCEYYVGRFTQRNVRRCDFTGSAVIHLILILWIIPIICAQIRVIFRVCVYRYSWRNNVLEITLYFIETRIRINRMHCR